VTGEHPPLSDVATLHVVPAVALSVTKTSSADPVAVENPLIYTVTVTNAGPSTAVGVRVTDTLPSGVSFGSATPSQGTGCAGTDPVVCALGNLADGASATVTILVTPLVTGTLTNAVEVAGADPSGNSVSDTDTATVSVIRPAVDLEKQAHPVVVNVGDTVAYTITVQNTGDSDLAEVAVEDALPGCELAGPTDDAGTPGVLDVGEAWVYTCSIAAGEEDIENTATVTATHEAGGTVSDSGTATVRVIHPAVELEKRAEPTLVNAGDLVTYTIMVENTGDSELVDVQVDDALAGCELVGPAGDAGQPGVLDVGEAWAYTCTVTAGEEDIENTATVEARDEAGGTVDGSGTAFVDVINPFVWFTKEADPAMAHAGDRVTYTLRVENTGDSALMDVQVDDALAGCELVGPVGDAGQPGVLDVGEVWAYTCTMTVGQEDIENTATLEARDEAGGTVRDTAHARVDVVHPEIGIAKTPDEQTVREGQSATFTIEVVNTGDVTLTQVTVTDVQSPECGRVIGELAAGESASHTCEVHGVQEDFTNVATVSGVDPIGGWGNGTDSAHVTVELVNRTVYMPLVMRATDPPAPDLVVESVRVASGYARVVIKNQGEAAVLPADAFWVDLYVDPYPVPTGVNQIWNALSSEGAVWGVEGSLLPLEPGGVITLMLGDDYFWEEYSNFPDVLSAGTPIYVQVDSADVGTTYGAVLESHEIVGGPYNNIMGPVFSTPGGLSEQVGGDDVGVAERPSARQHNLPVRP